MLYLLERLFAIWPEAPVEFLVGDGLYAHPKDFSRELLFRFGIDPCFPWRADYAERDGFKRGVPLCDCAKEPMSFKQRKGKWWGPKQHAQAGMARPEWCPERDRRLRYEYVCALDNPACKSKTVGAWEDPRVHTYLPHAGTGKRCSTRKALLYQRNVVEAHYSALQRLGKQGRGVNRPAWANDLEVNWTLGLASTYLTAKRLVAENGLLKKATEVAAELDLLEDCSETHGTTIAPGASIEEWLAVKKRLMSELDVPAPPTSWVAEHGGQTVELNGSAKTLAESWGYVAAAGHVPAHWVGWKATDDEASAGVGGEANSGSD